MASTFNQSDPEGAKIAALLERYRAFQECLLRGVRLSNFGTALVLEFDYVWDDDKPASAVLSDPRVVYLELGGLHEARIVTALPASVLEDPAGANWGLTEVAVVRLIEQSDLLWKYHESALALHHLAILWEGESRIDVVFTSLDVRDEARLSRKAGERRLTDNERGTLLQILERAPAEAVSQLCAQVRDALVVGGSDTFLELRVDASVPRASFEDGHLPMRAFVAGLNEDEPQGELLVWIKNGYLAGFEFAWFTDDSPAEWPSSDRLRFEADA
jgi:hypothetical protein